MAEFEYYSALSSSAVENIHGHDASASFPVFPSNLPELGPEHRLEPHEVTGPPIELTGRELYSKEQWDAKKPVIWRLYNVDNKPYKRVVEILRTEHNFYPTRRQFYRKIDEWGFKKNIKDNEMRDIAQNLCNGASDLSDTAFELRSQRVDLAKIQRWQKKHKLATKINGPLPNNSMTGNTSNISKSNMAAQHSLDPPFETLTSDSADLFAHKPQIAPEVPTKTLEDEKIPLSYWPLVDVPGSPNLSRLFEALRIECSEEIPPLSIDSPITASVQQYLSDIDINQVYYEESNDEITERSQSKALKTSNCAVTIHPKSTQIVLPSKLAIPKQSFSEWNLSQWDFCCGQPFNIGMNLGPMKALSPFPITEQAAGGAFPNFRHSRLYGQRVNPEMKALQLKNKWLRLRRVWGAADPRTLEAQHELARQYTEMGKYEQAESLLRRLASCLHNSRGYKCRDTLWAYLDIIDVLNMQGRYRQAAKIHHKVNETILNITSPEDELCLESARIMALGLYSLNKDEEACKMRRNLLQIRLSTLGLRREETLGAIAELALSLQGLGRMFECEELLDITIQLQRVIRNVGDRARIWTMSRMIEALQTQCRHEEGTKLAMALLEQSTTLLGPNDPNTIHCRFLACMCLIKQGRAEKGEVILREVLNVLEKCFGNSHAHTISVMEVIAPYLVKTGRYEEAAKYYEIIFANDVENRGVENSSTIESCDRLGRCYEELGRSGEAFSLYQDTVDQLGSEVGEDHPATQEVRGWIDELQDILTNGEEDVLGGGEELNSGEESAEDGQLDEALELDDVTYKDGGNSKVVEEDEVQEEEWMEALFDFQKLQGDANNHYG